MSGKFNGYNRARANFKTIFSSGKWKNLLILSFCLSFLLFSVACLAMPMQGENTIAAHCIRLHILANSDSEQDQAVKLLVRDRIKEVSDDLFKSCTTMEQAEDVVLENKQLLLDTANTVLQENGFDYAVDIKTGWEQYPVRRYSEFCFPAGEYYSVRVLLGQAKGKNWWCVLFPPLCLSSAVSSVDEDVDKLASAGFTDREISVLTDDTEGPYEIRFKLWDLLTDLL